jgi:protein-arginine kinase activator protein McsA
LLGQLVKQEDFAGAAEVRDALRAAIRERDSLHLQLRLHAQLAEGRQREEETHKWLMADKVRGLEHVLSALVEEELYEEARNVSQILRNETRARDQVHQSFDDEWSAKKMLHCCQE